MSSNTAGQNHPNEPKGGANYLMAFAPVAYFGD